MRPRRIMRQYAQYYTRLLKHKTLGVDDEIPVFFNAFDERDSRFPGCVEVFLDLCVPESLAVATNN